MAIVLQKTSILLLLALVTIQHVHAAQYIWGPVGNVVRWRNQMVELANQDFTSYNNIRSFIDKMLKLRETLVSFYQGENLDPGQPISSETETEELRKVKELLGGVQMPNFHDKLSFGKFIEITLEDPRMETDVFYTFCVMDHDGGYFKTSQVEPFVRTFLTSEKICTDTKTCVPDNKIVYLPQDWGSIEAACTANDECDIPNAIKKMVGLLWYKMGYWITRQECRRKHSYEKLGKDFFSYSADEMFRDVFNQTEEIISYAYMLSPYNTKAWEGFSTKALEMRAFSQLDGAMDLVEEKIFEFKGAFIACGKIPSANKFCDYGEIFKQYCILKNQQTNIASGKRRVRDLRAAAEVELTRTMELRLQSLRSAELLDAVVQLNANLKVQVEGISTYFFKIAEYDKKIASEDVTFIKTKLQQFEDEASSTLSDLSSEFYNALHLAEAKAIAGVATATAELAITVAENGNPLKWIFGGGPELSEILEKTNALAQRAKDLATMKLIINKMGEVVEDTHDIMSLMFRSSGGNKNQLEALHRVMEAIKNGDSIDAEGGRFVELYAQYTPQVDKPRLAESNAIWTAYKDTMCDQLKKEGGLVDTAIGSVAEVGLICESLEGTLARFFTLREEIYDFQFELINAMNRVVRGSIATDFASKITPNDDIINVTSAMRGFLMIQNRLQADASLYCDILHYKDLSKKVIDACSTVDGFFRESNLEALFQRRDDMRYDLASRTVYIPIYPTIKTKEESLGFLDIQKLAEGKRVTFKLPFNITWLAEHGWLRPKESNYVPFVESLKIYLPKKDYPQGNKRGKLTTTYITANAFGSIVNWHLPRTGTKYILPRDHSTYVTEYQEGFMPATCDYKNRMGNLYTVCEEQKLPEICDITKRVSGASLLPTLFSTWTLRLDVSQGSHQTKWIAPNSTTNLLIRAKVELRLLPDSSKKRSNVPKKSADVVPANVSGCCDNNRYRVSIYNDNCKECPAESTSKYGGLYCERNQPAKRRRALKKRTQTKSV